MIKRNFKVKKRNPSFFEEECTRLIALGSWLLVLWVNEADPNTYQSMEWFDVHVQACLLRWSNSLRFGHGTALPISDTRSVGLIEKVGGVWERKLSQTPLVSHPLFRCPPWSRAWDRLDTLFPSALPLAAQGRYLISTLYSTGKGQFVLYSVPYCFSWRYFISNFFDLLKF